LPRYRLTLAYDGTGFCGWQKQEPPVPGSEPDELGDRPRTQLRTVQQAVEEAVRQVVRQPVTIIGASRTDSGVHAQRQTAAFTAEGEGNRPPDDRLALALNARLPDDVVAVSCARTRDDFDPIRDCLRKGYRYSFHTSHLKPLWERGRVKLVWSSLDDAAMDAAAAVLVGEHDFAAFAAAGHGRESTVRTVLSCRVWRSSPSRVQLDVSATGFLWNMVRIIAGTLLEVGMGRRDAASVARALACGDRAQSGPTAGPEGLCLLWGLYPEDDPALILPGDWAE
jgi:tRNA pseudouridine38-40 synthase